MNQPLRPPLSVLVPESAPFTPDQRQWLNGFFAGLLDADAAALSPAESLAVMHGIGAPALADDGMDDAPWHDQTLPIGERMTMAEGKPLKAKMYAAMGQQDCGQCGYNCADYATALAGKAEARLNLCVPGGKDTNRMLKALAAEIDSAPAAARPSPTSVESAIEHTPMAGAPSAVLGRSRDNPVTARFVSRIRLNKPGSEKETWHVEFDLSASDLDYIVGDSFGVFPLNDSDLVDDIVRVLGASPDLPIGSRTLREVLTDGVALSPAPDALFQLLSYITGGERRKKAQALGAGDDPDGDALTLDVLAALQKFPGAQPDPEAFIESLDPLQPRLYSISSSPKVTKGRLTLTVDAVRYAIKSDKPARKRLGTASTFLGARIRPGDALRVYVQKAHGFGLPANAAVPIIMVGPGTGIAPFRAFLQERMATAAQGRNWLFYGHQKRDYDFFYEQELNGMKAAGVLTRLSLAWSRDGDEKFYVQNRMAEVGRELWAWLADGAHVYICGDAQRMAKDVERTLVDIVATHGARSQNEAVAYVAELRKSGRYQTDVY